VDLEGNLLLGAKSALHIEESNLIPEEPFEGVEPDDTDYEGYLGNVSCSIYHSFVTDFSQRCTGCWIVAALFVHLASNLRHLTNMHRVPQDSVAPTSQRGRNKYPVLGRRGKLRYP
jgi:hypothetical protein